MRANGTQQLTEDLAAFAKDAEEIFGGTAGDLAEKATEIRDRLAEALAAADAAVERLQPGQRVRSGVIDQMIRDRPYQAVGLAVGVGLLLGLFLNRKK